MNYAKHYDPITLPFPLRGIAASPRQLPQTAPTSTLAACCAMPVTVVMQRPTRAGSQAPSNPGPGHESQTEEHLVIVCGH